jgi:cobalt/nickel transport system permease protein
MNFLRNTDREHSLTRIDARIKLIVALIILIMILSYKGFIFPVTIALLCAGLCAALRIPLRTLALRVSEPMLIALILTLIKFFFSGEEPLFTADLFGLTLTGHRDGLIEGLMIASRIMGAVSVITVVGFTTPFAELMAGLAWLRIPKGFIEILMFAYRYIFVLFEEAMIIYQAQRNRLGYSSMRRGLSSFGTLTGSLVLKAFEHSQNTTVSMVQRGYDGTMPLLKHKPFKRSEVLASLMLLILMGFVWKI